MAYKSDEEKVSVTSAPLIRNYDLIKKKEGNNVCLFSLLFLADRKSCYTPNHRLHAEEFQPTKWLLMFSSFSMTSGVVVFLTLVTFKFFFYLNGRG